MVPPQPHQYERIITSNTAPQNPKNSNNKHKGRSPSNIDFTISKLHPQPTLRRALSSPTLETVSGETTTSSEEEIPRESEISHPAISPRDNLLAWLNYAWPLKHRSRIQISSPKASHIRPGLTDDEAKGVLKTVNEFEAKISMSEWIQNDIKRHSGRISFSTPDLLLAGEQAQFDSVQAVVPASKAFGNQNIANKRQAREWNTYEIPQFSRGTPTREFRRLEMPFRDHTDGRLELEEVYPGQQSHANSSGPRPVNSATQAKQIHNLNHNLQKQRDIKNNFDKETQLVVPRPFQTVMKQPAMAKQRLSPGLAVQSQQERLTVSGPAPLAPPSGNRGMSGRSILSRAQGALASFFGGKRNIHAASQVNETIQMPMELIYDGEDGAWAFANLVLHPDFRYKDVTSIKLYLNANDWGITQDDKYGIALGFFVTHADHSLNSLEIYIKGNILFTKDSFTLGAGLVRMAYLKNQMGVSKKYEAWKTLYDGTSSSSVLKDYPLPLRRETKRTVRAILAIRNVRSVRIFGAMEASLKDEIMANCQSSLSGTPAYPRTPRLQGDYLPRLVAANNFTLPTKASVSKSLPDIEILGRPRKKRTVSRPPSMHIGFPVMFSTPIAVSPETQKRRVVSKPLPQLPPKTASSPNDTLTSNFMSSPSKIHGGSSSTVVSEDISDNVFYSKRLSSDAKRTPRIPVWTDFLVPSLKSMHDIALPSSAHLFIDRDIPIADDDSDDDTVIAPASQSHSTRLEKFPTLAPFADFDAKKTLDKPGTAHREINGYEIHQNNDEGWLSDSELTKPNPASVTTPRYSLRTRLSNRHSTGLERFSLGQQVSRLWKEFEADATEAQVINTEAGRRGGTRRVQDEQICRLEMGPPDHVVRICAHKGERVWNTDTKVRDGFVADCVVGWKVVMSEHGWTTSGQRV